MYVGLLQFDVLIHDAESLKDKRRVMRCVKDRLHREHMVAVAEVGALDSRHVARMGLAAVSNDGKYLSDVLDRVLAKLRAMPGGEWSAAAVGGELGDFTKQIVGADVLEGEGGEPLWTPEERREVEED